MKFIYLLCFSIFPLMSAASAPIPIKLYAFDCGRIEVANLASFSDTGDYDNQAKMLVNPCFLVMHPKGNLLWDTGFSDAVIQKPETAGDFHFTKSVKLADQLKQLHLTPADIQYVAVSHSHVDHMGGLDQLGKSTWVIQQAEVAYGKTHPNPFVIDASNLSNWLTAHKKIINGDEDVFADGTVRILTTPGHTPGHQSLLIKLPKTGFVIISGDVFHQRASVAKQLVPVINTNRADTLASEDRIKGLMRNYSARLVVQHDQNDFAQLPKFPKYLD